MPIFGGLGLAGVPSDPHVSDGDYVAQLLDAELREYKVNSDDHPGATGHKLVVTYEIIEGDSEGLEVRQRPLYCNPWNSVPRKAYVRKFLTIMGFRPEEFENIEEDDLIGRVSVIRVRGGSAWPIRYLPGYGRAA